MKGQDYTSNMDTVVTIQANRYVHLDAILIPNSIIVSRFEKGQEVLVEDFELKQDSLFFGSSLEQGDTLQIAYRGITAPLFENEKLLDSNLIAKTPKLYIDPIELEDQRRFGQASGGDIKYSGSFARGFSVGNRQDLVLSSDLDLQLSGKIGNEIDILAAISDQNIPLQPEGNTQQLREFDKVFIQLSKDNHKLLVGDYEIQSYDSRFLQYFKKWQGLLYDDYYELDNGGNISTSFAAALSRGQYNRNVLAVQEGNQGPYRLTGANGESFIIIVAATERVYLDGVLLVRGIEEDYVIDYNTAEITFTPNLLVTKDVRITVDFEFNNQNYQRSGAQLKTNYIKDKTQIKASFYTEQDGRNTGGSSSVTANQKQQLANLGDNLNNAFGSSIQTFEEEDLNPVTYALIDTIVSEMSFDSVLVFSSNMENELVTAQFSFVGDLSGNYILVPGANNGTIFQWIAPVNGIPQGNFEPIVRLSAPERTSMLSIGAQHQINKKWNVASEFSASNQDLNRFSELGNDNNGGIALFSELSFRDSSPSKDLNVEAGINYEFIHANFRTINPFRNAEFNRDWNLKPGAELSQQHFGNAFLQVQKGKFLSLKFNSAFLDNQTGVQGFKQSADIFFSRRGFTFTAKPSFLSSSNQVENSTFWRPNFDLSQTIGQSADMKLGFRTLIEQNSRRLQSDSLSLESINFRRFEAYLENSSSKNLHTKLLLARRIDLAPAGEEFELATTADELNLQGHWRGNTSQSLNWNFTARNLRVDNETLSNEANLQTYLGKLSYSFQAFNDILRSTTAYELGSGQENKRNFIFLEVEPGQGIFQWIDYNGDGTQQIEEFEIAPNIDQATFIRVERPTLEFISTQSVLFNENLQLSLKPIWFDKKGAKKFFSKFSTATNIQISRKNNSQEGFQFWNPFNLSFDNEEIVSAQSLIRNNLYFNRGNPKFDIYIGRSTVFTAQALDIGTLRNEQTENYGHYQVKIKQWLSHTFDIVSGTNLNDASIFEQRKYEIDFLRVTPALQFLISKKLNARAQYAWENQENRIGASQNLTKNELSFAIGYQNTSKRSIDLNLTYSDIAFDGPINDPASFILLDGLQNGVNFEWQITANQQISRNLQLLINYNGRKAGQLSVIHFGNVQVKATF